MRLKRHVLASKVVGTDDTPVRVLDRRLRQHARAVSGRMWGSDHPAVIYDYTPTREPTGPEAFLQTYRGFLQADAYVAYDSFFTRPERGMIEVACMAHARHVYQALDNDPSRMRTVLLLIAQLYRVEKRGREHGVMGEDLRVLRQQGARFPCWTNSMSTCGKSAGSWCPRAQPGWPSTICSRTGPR